MALTSQDFVHGVDFTGVNPATGADHNNLVDVAAPVLDSATEGKGIAIWTIDSALGVPVVPNTPAVVKWKRYIWIRVPFAGATIKAPSIYVWNDDAPNDATYRRWLVNATDFTDIQAQIDAIVADVTTVEGIANGAAAMASAANILASNANLNAIAANNTANAAAANATTALANAATAQATAVTAGTLATAANANAATALAAANAATAAVGALSNTVGASTFFNNGVEYNIVGGVVFDVAHGLGAVPKFVRVVLVNKTTEFGYAVGDEVDAGAVLNATGQVRLSFIPGASATNVFLICVDSAGLIFSSKVDGTFVTLTAGNWRAKVYCWK